jgi:hypothetical protein
MFFPIEESWTVGVTPPEGHGARGEKANLIISVPGIFSNREWIS